MVHFLASRLEGGRHGPHLRLPHIPILSDVAAAKSFDPVQTEAPIKVDASLRKGDIICIEEGFVGLEIW